MNTITASDYVRLMTPWLQALPRFLSRSPADPARRFYGTGESAHWPVQSNLNVAAALAVLAEAPELESCSPVMSRDTIRAVAIDCFRYVLDTHRTIRRLPATDGKYWGGHWISVLGLERAAHGIALLAPYLTEADHDAYRRVRLDEAAYILNDFEVVAGTTAEGRNHPESNIWNGAFLLRTALDLPDAPHRAAMIDKATDCFVAGISIPSDRDCEREYNGRTVRERHVGANFTEPFSLDHHGYMNVGYSVICLSNIAMAAYDLRTRGHSVPDALFHNAGALWKTLRHFIFPDGRLLRIGGDTRSRYTYCQCYAIPVFMLAADQFGDATAITMEKRWLRHVRTELAYSGDGSCYTRRLAPLFETSPYYAFRLESDHILSLSYGACWRRLFDIPASAPSRKAAPFDWHDTFHDAVCIRTPRTVRSWVRAGGQGPTAVCAPLGRSDMAEWQGNLCGFAEGNRAAPHDAQARIDRFPGGFVAVCNATLREDAPIGEGEERYPIVRMQSVHAALPDGRTLIVLQRGRMIKDAMLRVVYSMNALIPNDVFNKFRRMLTTPTSTFLITGNHHQRDCFDTLSDRVTVDNSLSLFSLTPGATIKIVREAGQNIHIRHGMPVSGSLYAERFCLTADTTPAYRRFGEVLFDDACAVAADMDSATAAAAPDGTFEQEANGLRRVTFTGGDGVRYLLLAHFGDATVVAEHPRATRLSTGQTTETTTLAPDTAWLLRLPADRRA